jgi:hypothetical protein
MGVLILCAVHAKRHLILNKGPPYQLTLPLKSVCFLGMVSESHPKFVAFLNEYATTVNANLLNINRRI